MTRSCQPEFRFSFTASSLRPELVGIVAAQFQISESWLECKRTILSSNALQARSPASAVRMETEIRQRLKALTPSQLLLLNRSTADLRVHIAWLGAVKNSSFLYEFAAGPLRTKLELHDNVLRSSDYERFLEEMIPHHPEIEQLRPSTAVKVRRVLLLMLREVGILIQGSDLGEISRPIVVHELQQAILEDDPRWLAAFLVPDEEIRNLRGAP